MKKIRFGTIHADYITQKAALDAIVSLARGGKGGFVVTPNIDHVVLAQSSSELRSAYADASLSLVDGMPLKWMSHIVGEPLPEKISGSDLIHPLMERCAKENLKVYFLGAAPGVAQAAAEALQKEIQNLNIVGTDSPPMGFHETPTQEKESIEKMLNASPDIVLLALGCPKQELLMHRWFKNVKSNIVYLGIGASLDFIAGNVRRCPPWISEIGLEWLFRISQDPKRLVKRYLVRDAAIIPLFLKMLTASKTDLLINKQVPK